MDRKVNRRKKIRQVIYFRGKFRPFFFVTPFSAIVYFDFSFSILEFIYITFRIRLNDCTIVYKLSTRAEQGSEN